MSVNKLLSISIIIVSAVLLSGNCHAYNSEGGLEENESFRADYSIWMGDQSDDYWFKWYTQTPEGTYVYRPNTNGLDALGVFSWTSWRIVTHFLSGSDIGIWTSWELQGKTFNPANTTTSPDGSYENKGTKYVTGYLFETTGGGIQETTCKKNVIGEYFSNDTSRANGFVGADEINNNKPDYVEVKMVVGSGMQDIEHTETFGVTMSGDQAEGLATGETDTDYGFGSGTGGEGGVGGIYSEVGKGIGDGDSGIQPVFQILFYCLIPLIFILSVMKMIGRLTDV